MGKKRRASASRSSSPTATKKPSVIERSDRQRIGRFDPCEYGSDPKIVLGRDNDGGTNTPVVDDEELRLIESTMIELLLKRGPEKTC